MSSTTERRRYAPSTVGTLRGFLLGLQGFPAVVHELLQNAEDAGAKEFHLRFTPSALWVGNDEVFGDDHFAALATPAAGSKRHDLEKIGSFGIGFTSVYQLTDAPEIMSRGQRHTLRPLEDAVDIEYGVVHEWTTTIRLPWAFEVSEVRTALDNDPVRPEQLPGFLAEARAALTQGAVFLSHVERLRLLDGDTLVEDVRVRKEGDHRVVRTLTGEVAYRLHETEVRGAAAERLVQAAEREGRVRLAVPEEVGEDFRGLFYAALPTQERTFLPFHLDADFYPHPDRKSLLWDGNGSVKQQWNAAVLRAASGLLPTVLEALRDSGVSALYGFAHASLLAPGQASQTRAGAWVEECAMTVRRTFGTRSLLLGARTGWVTRERLILPVAGSRMPSELQHRVEVATDLVFPPDDHLDDFADFFGALGTEVLDAERFVTVLPELLRGAPLLPAGSAVWEAVRPVVAYLRRALEASPRPETLLVRHRQTLRTLPFLVDRAGRATTAERVRHVEEEWTDVLETWFGDAAVLSATWVSEAGARLSGLLDVLTPAGLLTALTEMDADAIVNIAEAPEILPRLYAFLSSGPFDRGAATLIPLCRGRDGGLYPATRMVLSGEIRDPFGLVTELDPALAEAFPALFSGLDVRVLDGDRYFTELLPQLVRKQEGRRDAVLRHLATSLHLSEARRAVWRGLPIVRTVEGRWVPPLGANFEHPLLEQLFPDSYNAVAHDLAEDRDVRRFFQQLGVTSTPTPEDLARIVEDRVGEPVTAEALTLRRELVRHALAEPDVLRRLRDVRWLPDDTRSRWWSAGQLWSPRRRALVGREREPERAFLGLDLTAEEEQELGLSEPGVDTALRHLLALKTRGEGMPPEALPWLEERQPTVEQARKLRELPLFRAEKSFREADHFFLEKHTLAPYRGLLSKKYMEAYPRLVQALGIRDRPTAEDYAAVLLDVAHGLSDGGRVRAETSDLVKHCLNRCAAAWKRREPEPAWVEPLRGARVVPVGVGDDLRILRPGDTLRLDLPESELERYGLGDARPYLVQGVGNTGFLKALGVRGLKDVLRVSLSSSATEGVASAYTRRLRDLLPAVVRYMHHLQPHKTPEELEQDVLCWQYVSMPVIRAELAFPTFSALRSRQVQLEHEVDREAYAILLKRDADEFVPGVALEQALALGEAPHLSALLTYAPERAQKFLDAQKIGPLPPGFGPAVPLLEAEAVDPGHLERVASGGAGEARPSSAPAEPAGRVVPKDSGPVRDGAPPSPTASGSLPMLPRSSGASHTGAQPPGDGAGIPFRSGSPTPPASPEELRGQGELSARNAAAGRDRVAGEDAGPGERAGRGFRRAGDMDIARTRFRNYVHVGPEGGRTPVDGSAEHNRAVDATGMALVMRFERMAGRTPRDDSDEPEGGYDIRSEGPDGVRLIEVKTLSGTWGPRGVTMSRKQMSTAFGRDDRFWLYVVERASGGARLWCIRNPAWRATSYTFADDWADPRYAEGPFSEI